MGAPLASCLTVARRHAARVASAPGFLLGQHVRVDAVQASLQDLAAPHHSSAADLPVAVVGKADLPLGRRHRRQAGRERGAVLRPWCSVLHLRILLIAHGSGSWSHSDAVYAHPGSPPTARRAVPGAVATAPGTALFAVGGEPGCAYTPSEWDQDPLP